MRRLFTLAVLGLVSLAFTPLFSQPVTFSINPQTSNTMTGQQVCINVQVSNFTSVVSAQWSINYNSSLLQYAGASNFNLPGLSASNVGNPTPGNITFSWLSDDVTNGTTLPGDQNIFQICFDALAAGTSNISFSGTPTPIEVTNSSGNVIQATFNNGSVNITGGGGGPGNLTFTASNETVESGNQVCVDIEVQNFTGIVSAQFSINYNSAVLQYTGAQGINLPGVSGSNIGNPTPGNITFSWVANDVVNGETVNNGTVIFQLCFTAIGASGTSSDITFSGSPTPIEVTNAMGNSLNPTFTNGSVMVQGGSFNGLVLSAPDVTAGSGTQVCVDISAQNFTDIVSMQFSINYSGSVLTYASATNFNIPAFTASNIGNPGGPASGNITVSWVSDDVLNGSTVPDGPVFTLCFNVVGAGGTSSPIDFSGTPTPVEVSGPGGNVNFMGEDGSVTVETTIQPTDFVIELGDVSGPSGTQVCVPVIAFQNFDNIVSMQYSINYDGAMMTYVNATGFNLPGLTASNIGNPGGPSSGVITVAWVADNVVDGATIADGETLFELCFNLIAANCDSTEMNIDGTPTPIEITNSDSELITLVQITSEVDICNSVVPPDPLVLSASEEIDAPGQTVCVEFTAVDGFDNIASMVYSVNYDPAILEFVTANGFDLPGLNLADFTNPGGPGSGNVVVNWTADNPAVGETVADGTVIFRLCFEIIGEDGDVSDITFSGNPTAISITNPDGDVDLETTNGSVTVEGPSCPPVDVTGTVTNTCSGANGGAIQLNPTGGDGNFTYAWSHGPNTKDVNNLAAGNYSVTVSSCNFTDMASFTVGTFPAINITNTVVTNVDCFNESTGSVALQVTGTSPLSYNWSGSGPIGNPNAQNISGLQAGTYRVTITDGNSCQLVSQNFSVTQPAAALASSATNVNNVDCFGGTDGAITLNTTGGTSPYSYDWTPNLPNLPNPTGLSAGNYSVVVEDANGCQVSINNIAIQQPNALQITVNTVTDESGAGGNGAIDVSVSGGTTPYTYSWNGPGGPYSTQDLNGISQGTYTLTVTDANNCTDTESATVKKPLQITVDETNNACFGQTNGSIFVSVSGGNQPYTYLWVGPGGPYVVEDLTNVGAGNYQLTVFDVNGDFVNQIVTITQPGQAFEIGSATVNNLTSPNFCDGQIVINGLTGGSPNYTFQWSNGGSGVSINNLCAGNYSVTVIDANGCEAYGSYTVAYVPPPLLQEFNQAVPVTCFGEDNGVWNVAVEGGTAPYDFVFSNGANIQSLDGEVQLTGLPAGPISVTVTDSDNPAQVVMLNTTITAPNPVTLTMTNIFPATELGNNGAITIGLTGGTLPYSYQWSHGFFGQNPVNLAENCYTLTVEDGNDCVFQFDPICVPTLEVTSVDVQDAVCNNDTNGSIAITIDGGINQPLTYSWIGPNGPIPVNETQLSDLPAGTYTLVVTDALGVSTPVEQIEVGYQSLVSLSAASTSDFNGFEVSCFGANDGAAIATASNGQSPYTYEWCNSLGANPTVSNLAAGSYCVVVTDAAGCTANAEVIITQPEPMDIIADIVSISCSGEEDGEILLVIDGGVPGYSYLWDDFLNQKTNPAILLDGGAYTVTVTDANGCQQTASFDVVEPGDLAIEVISTPDNGNNDGALTAVVTGGTEPFFYNWDTGRPEDDESVVSGLTAGEYNLTVTDANGCVAIAQGFIADGTIECLDYRNVVTPDGDGMNEEFRINCLELYPDHHLQIFNRWGQLVFETEAFGNDWMGTNLQGELVEEGAYFFVFEYVDNQGSQNQVKGHITLIR